MASQIGLSGLHYAILLTDPVGGTATYEAPVAIPGAISCNINANPTTGTLFADDGPSETATTLGEIQVELNVADLPLEVQAVLLGHNLSGGVMVRKGADTPPFVALGFKTLKSNGKYRYVWLTKGKFAVPEMAAETKNDGVNFQTPTITGSFVKREADDVWIRHTDEDVTGYVAALGTNWFTTPNYTAP